MSKFILYQEKRNRSSDTGDDGGVPLALPEQIGVEDTHAANPGANWRRRNTRRANLN